VTSTFTGFINGETNRSTQCPPGNPLNALCPRIGQQVNLNCSINYNNSYNIISPNSSIVTNRNLSFIMKPTDFGSYTCTSYNDCNEVSNTIILKQCNSPSSICLATGSLANIFCMPCVEEKTVTSYTWYKNGVFFSNNRNLIDVGPGTYVCTVRNHAGSDSQITRVV
uniref:Ig-like domain-containing protein n=1 Tax=Amphimedon queenslandica TaxID=400682 RepID=A0A1X7TYB7_AMPQE